MQEIKVIVVLIVGVIVIFAAIYALLFLRSKVSGTIKVGKNEITGSGAVVFLGVGLILVLVGMGWNQTAVLMDQAVQDKNVAVLEKDQAIEGKSEVLQELARLDGQIQVLKGAEERRVAQPPSGARRITIPSEFQQFLDGYQLSPKIRQEIQRLPRRQPPPGEE